MRPTNLYPSLLKHRIFFLFILTSIMAFSFQGTRGFYDSTETRYAECAREMIETGNFLEPQLAYKPHWTKPPMIYWVIAGGMGLFGENEWGARMPNATCFCILVLLTMGIAEAISHSEKVGLLAGLIMATSPLALGGSFNLSSDLLLTVFETLAVFGFVKAIFSADTKYFKFWVTLMWVAFGLAFLTKGPVGLLPLLPIFIYQKFQKSKVSLFYWPGFLLFILIGLSWYIAVELRHPGLLSRLAYEEIFLRNTTNRFNRNPQWYKLFTVTILPLFVGAGLWAIYFGRLIKGINLKTIFPSIKKSFLLLWLFIPLILFSLSKSRLPLYVLPLLVPLTIILAIFIDKIEGLNNKPLNLALISALLLFIAKGIFSYIPHKNNVKPFNEMIRSYDPKTTQFYTVDDNDFFGPLFYLKGNLKNVSSSDTGQILKEINDKTVFLLVKKDKKELIESQVRESKHPFVLKEFKEWLVLIVETKAS